MSEAVKRANINGKTYIIGRLRASEGREILLLLLRNLGPGLGEALVGAAGVSGLAEMPAESLGRALQDVCLRLNADDLARASEAFGGVSSVVTGKTQVQLTPEFQDTHFSGALGAWTQWIIACVEFNYADFLGYLTNAAVSRAAANAASKNSSGNTQTDQDASPDEA